MAKKNLVTYGLIAAGVVAAILIIRKMNKSKKRSSVEAGAPIVQSEDEFIEDARVVKEEPTFVKGAQSVIDIFKGLKRTPEAKAAAQAKRTTRKATKQEARRLRAKNLRKKVGEISVLY
jgi:hypothetical protein